MLKQLQFVRGAVNKYKMDMALSHFVIRDGRVTGYNGILAISSPIPLALDCQPDAVTLIKAVGNCKAAVELTMTPAGKLRLKSGAFKSFIKTHPEPIAEVTPEGNMVPVRGPALLDALRKLVPFVNQADDIQNGWSQGILFSGGSAFATNNYVLTECWVESMFPRDANVPLATVRELLRINEPPTHVSMGNGNMTFYFEDDRWLRTQLYGNEWPDVRDMLPKRSDSLKALPYDFWDGVEVCRDFKDERRRIYLDGDIMRTSRAEEEGASVECDGCGDGIYNVDHLWSLKEHIVAANLSTAPGKFMGDKIRGIINPMRG